MKNGFYYLLWIFKKGDLRLVPKGEKNRNGYRRIRIQYEGKTVWLMTHILCWILYHQKLVPKGMQINHKNLNREDNARYNLELVSQSKNLKHAAKMRKKGVKGGKR